ncbi:tRNA (N6-isopentenyl adenosine(37)-C2)-methylthiotransferase MiaB [Criibacterium bergeronii]|uniref:tRNA-2-methylthio-N(6)-dimethylallyladenosine synthase n=1 Tax=Criibacterium bergeronii TaxID=1871336 RepID=A0A552VDQ1_9FIRM|nr:tRNA (N6-isopentenyl adenosine(37)-C2)-methylthiotransferase MiaB [Criibacterium bergeronii]TRW28606.1 tRNA (N6-isopentenyl adenosine(37)-C2)-methylthiotransferase MiaB [Criibacterium bergeronii]
MNRINILDSQNFTNQEYYVDLIKAENDRFETLTGKKKSYLITTFGCQMNEHDSENLSGIMQDMGYIEADSQEEADIIVYNTCAVRENAEDRFFGNIGALKNLKKQHPDKILATCGCMMQQDKVVDEILAKYRHVDLIFGTHNIYKFPELLYTYISQEDKKTVSDVWKIDGDVIEGLPSIRRYDFKSFVNIMYGCNNFCTYCIVPYTRGRERSRLPKDIIKEIELLAKSGVKEITLLGQNVNSYGNNFEEKYTFPMLLKDIDKIDGIQRVRFMTSHPKDISIELIDSFVELNKLCESLHLPVQSGSNSILQKMNRKYTRQDYLKKIEAIKSKVPDIALTTDIIVGFPGETDQDFKDTLDLVKQVEYDLAFTFLYSPRPGTKAAVMTDQVPEEVKKERFNQLLETVNEIAARKNKAYLGKIEEVLVEGLSKNNDQILSGRNRKNKLINFAADKSKIGQIVNVKITATKSFSLDGAEVD